MKILIRLAIINTITALLCAMVWANTAQGAEPARKRDMYYSGERNFCLHLLNNPDKAEKIEPVIGPALVVDLETGQLYAPKTRLYFVKSPMPGPYIWRMMKEGNWKAVLGYTPKQADTAAGRIVYDSRWRKYDDRCPGIFRIGDYQDPKKIVDTPTKMTLFDFDADGDGKNDKIYRYKYEYTGNRFAVADFKTCHLKQILSQLSDANLFRFDGKIYVIAGINIGRVSVYRINSLAREIDWNDETCHFTGIDRFTDISQTKHLFNKPEFRR